MQVYSTFTAPCRRATYRRVGHLDQRDESQFARQQPQLYSHYPAIDQLPIRLQFAIRATFDHRGHLRNEASGYAGVFLTRRVKAFIAEAEEVVNRTFIKSRLKDLRARHSSWIYMYCL
ncbi:hypothetical protein J6590_035273 [Homalodisca vitripennis]|nr:hypothetical protein J6590_035273 [Homalodisca vitripennis]